jgi:hypothetical protein
VAIKPTTAFPGKIAPADASYPYGKARNITAPGDGTGTPFNATLLNDVWGFFQHLLKRGGITPTETPDTAPASQYADGIRYIADTRVGRIALIRQTLLSVLTTRVWIAATWSPQLSLFVAVSPFDNLSSSASSQCVMTSPDGITWTIRTGIANVQWHSVTWSPTLGLFAAVGLGGTNSVMTSPDGITWTARHGGAYLNEIVWSPELGLFAAVGVDTIRTSTDGITWVSRTVPTPSPSTFESLEWSPELGKFVAISIVDNRIISSVDGITWTTVSVAAGFGSSGVAWSSELGLFVASTLTNHVRVSTDGITWTAIAIPTTGWNGTICSVKWVKEYGMFVVTNGTISASPQMVISFDGYAWEPVFLVGPQAWAGMAWSPERRRLITLAVVAGANNLSISL